MFKTIVAAVLVVGMLAGSEVMAQRDAGAKARREFGKGFWNSGNQATASRTVTRSQLPSVTRTDQAAAPGPVASESYQSFSYEPTPVVANEAPAQASTPGVPAYTSSPCENGAPAGYRSFSYEPSYRSYSYEPAVATSRSINPNRSGAFRNASPPQVRLRPGSGR